MSSTPHCSISSARTQRARRSAPSSQAVTAQHPDRRVALAELIEHRQSGREYSAAPIGRAALERIVHCAQGRSRSGKRNAPSAHGLYPLRLFAIVHRLQGSAQGLYALDMPDALLGAWRKAIAPEALRATSLADDAWLEHAAVVLVVAADYEAANAHFFDQQPDGRRGERYVHIEAGAVLQNMHLATLAEGLGGVIVAGFDARRLADLLALPAPLQPVALFCVGARAEASAGR
ncbi:MAG: nitroreductase [Salinisphaera sp.]|nr:nitroreductase family protein [Salinisphaera sp.]MBS62428.1 nitroreductase [Salinisphaera sp.]